MPHKKKRKKISSSLITKNKEEPFLKKKPVLKEIEEIKDNEEMDSLEDLYEDQAMSEEDITKFNKGNSGKKRTVFLVLVILFLSVAVLLSFLSFHLFLSKPTFVGDNVALNVTGVEEFISGDDVVYIIKYSNLESVDLKNLELTARYPKGFIFYTALPEPNISDNVWRFDELLSGENKQIKITGKLIGEQGSTKTLTAGLSYIPLNFKSEFKVINSFSTLTKGVPVNYVLDGPDEVLLGEETKYTIYYKNILPDVKLNDIKLVLDVPDSFSVSYSNPIIKEFSNEKYWEIEELEEEGEIVFSGTFNSVEDDLYIKLVDYLGINGKYYLQSQNETAIDVEKSDLELDLIVNSNYQSSNVGFGGLMRYNILVRNTSDSLMEGITVKFISNTLNTNYDNGSEIEVIDWDNINMIVDGKLGADKKEENVLDNKTIIWNGDNIISLKELSPGEEIEIPFTVNVLDASVIKRDHNINNLSLFQVENSVLAYIKKLGGNKAEVFRKSNKIINRIHTDLSLESKLKYYDLEGISVGSGPLPPKVGEKTTYRAYWTLKNSVNSLKDVYVIVVLPNNTKWENNFNVGAGEIIYSEFNNSITWHIEQMPISVKSLQAYFDISFTPQKKDIGEIGVLVPKVSVKAIDKSLAEEITIYTEPLTTVLEDSEKSKGKSIVVE